VLAQSGAEVEGRGAAGAPRGDAAIGLSPSPSESESASKCTAPVLAAIPCAAVVAGVRGERPGKTPVLRREEMDDAMDAAKVDDTIKFGDAIDAAREDAIRFAPSIPSAHGAVACDGGAPPP